MKHIVTSIEYAGLTLPVVKNDAGVDCVPLKPISELFGLRWDGQLMKVKSAWRHTFLGVCLIDVYDGYQHRKVTCIRIDRVEFPTIISVAPVATASATSFSASQRISAERARVRSSSCMGVVEVGMGQFSGAAAMSTPCDSWGQP